MANRYRDLWLAYWYRYLIETNNEQQIAEIVHRIIARIEHEQQKAELKHELAKIEHQIAEIEQYKPLMHTRHCFLHILYYWLSLRVLNPVNTQTQQCCCMSVCMCLCTCV